MMKVGEETGKLVIRSQNYQIIFESESEHLVKAYYSN
jgi:hypothetical protein